MVCHLLASALFAAVGLAPGVLGEPCLEVTGAVNPVGDDHTCAVWARGKYHLREGDHELENGKPVWHREESHVHDDWGIVVRFAARSCRDVG